MDMNQVTAKGIYSSGYVKHDSYFINETIKAETTWKNSSIPDNSQVLFEFDPQTEIALNVRQIPTYEYNFEVNVKAGNIVLGKYLLSDNGQVLRSSEGQLLPLLNSNLSVLTEERAKEKLKSFAIGGTLALFSLGVGAIAGIAHAAKKFLLVEVTTDGDEHFIVEMRPKHYELILTAKASFSEPVPSEEYRDSLIGLEKAKTIPEVIKLIQRQKAESLINDTSSWNWPKNETGSGQLSKHDTMKTIIALLICILVGLLWVNFSSSEGTKTSHLNIDDKITICKAYIAEMFGRSREIMQDYSPANTSDLREVGVQYRREDGERWINKCIFDADKGTITWQARQDYGWGRVRYEDESEVLISHDGNTITVLPLDKSASFDKFSVSRPAE